MRSFWPLEMADTQALGFLMLVVAGGFLVAMIILSNAKKKKAAKKVLLAARICILIGAGLCGVG